jgi:glutathione S-transferase
MADDLVLYTHPMSRGRIARWMLEEIGVPYRTELLDFGTTMKAPSYLALNPMGKVPTLTHGETVVADAFPAAKLAPPADKRGDYYRWLFFTAGPVEAAVSNRAIGFHVPPDKEVMIGYGTYSRVMDTLERAVSARPFVAGDQFTAADVYVGSHISWGLQFGMIEKRKAFEDYWDRLKNRPAHLRATQLDDAAMPPKAS